MPVSGVGSSGANYPAQPPTSGVPAYSFSMLGTLSDIAGSLGAKAASGASGVAAVGDSQDVENAEIQALADLAEIHLYLSGANPNKQEAEEAATDFLKLNQQYHFSDPNISALYTQASNYFTVAGDGVTVTGFKADSTGVQFSDWWTKGTGKPPVPGIQTAFGALNLLKNDISFGPSVPEYPAVMINICILYADALSTPIGKTMGQLDSSFWGTSNMQQLFPYMMATYAYQMTFEDPSGDKQWSTYNQMMSKTFDLLREVQPASGVNFVNFPQMVNEYSDLYNKMVQNPTWPPPQAKGISNNLYNNTFLYYANQGVSAIYQFIVDNIYTYWRGH